MKNKSSKQEIEREIKELFENNPSQKNIKKVKRLAMSKNIKLGGLRKKFCKKCYLLFNVNNSKIKIKKGMKIIKCKNCRHVSRYKLK